MSALLELTNGKAPGQWRRVLVDEFGDVPRWSAIVRCPDCSLRLSIEAHAISEAGQVSPSIGHPVGVSCSWHVTPRLLGWSPCPPAPEPKPFQDPCAACGKRARQLGNWGILGGGLVCPDCLGRMTSCSGKDPTP